ncbi:hypothetical protein AN964_10725 [Heyndrickxia shackletonii]|uniref:DUF5367 domain-containing protein n=1 Tax=Heyndrickxia shackletonii TaxID=157838 RepID=A0A0Q3WXM9_9BACI|nr:DUF5367 family protein [Heyndrickxia shackletonii]KQL53924.1 hypothetical protein AN964_10725 [Heyndrickxia shackletonii]NEY97796.1 DUF5367 domain-containing protein [Heyndrickxia shackletonii]
MKGNLITVIWGVLVWVFATMFFVFFGESVLFSPGTENFATSIILLETVTGLILWGVTYIYLLFDKSKNAPLKFGIIGTIIGLSLDTFSISIHHTIFPKLDDSQVIAFTAWMTFAYALYLFIPAMINQQRSKHLEI